MESQLLFIWKYTNAVSLENHVLEAIRSSRHKSKHFVSNSFAQSLQPAVTLLFLAVGDDFDFCCRFNDLLDGREKVEGCSTRCYYVELSSA